MQIGMRGGKRTLPSRKARFFSFKLKSLFPPGFLNTCSKGKLLAFAQEIFSPFLRPSKLPGHGKEVLHGFFPFFPRADRVPLPPFP